MPTTAECWEMGVLIERCACAVFHAMSYFRMSPTSSMDVDQLKRLHETMSVLYGHYSLFDQQVLRVNRLLEEILAMRTNRYNPQDRTTRDAIFGRLSEIKGIFKSMNVTVTHDICGSGDR